MTPAARRLIEAATTPPITDNAELQMAARSMIEREIDSAAEETEVAHLAERLENRGSRKWRWLLVGLMLAVSLPILIPAGERSVEESRLMDPYQHSWELLDDWRKSLPRETQILLSGDEAVSEPKARWKALWDLDPENPALHLDYARAHLREFDELPPDFLEVGARIDPGNGWYALLAAAVVADKTVERIDWTSDGPGGPEWRIGDTAAFDAARELLRQAAVAPRLDDYHIRLNEMHLRVLPEASDYLSFQTTAGAVGLSFRLGGFKFFSLADLVAAEAQRAAGGGDVRAFESLVSDWEILNRRLLQRSPAGIVDGLMIGSVNSKVLPVLGDAAAVLDVDEGKWHKRHAAMQARKSRLEERGGEFCHPDNSSLLLQTSGLISHLIYIDHEPLPLTKADLLPGVHTEHAVLARMLALALWLLLALGVALVFLARFLDRAVLRRMAERLSAGPQPTDWCWIAGIGGLLPFSLFMALRYLTPLGALEWTVLLSFNSLELGDIDLGREPYSIPIAQFVCLLLMVFTWTTLAARWRIGKAGACFGWRPRWRWLTLPVAALAPAAMVAAGFGVPPGDAADRWLVIAAALAGVNFIWLFSALVLRAFGSSEKRLRRTVIADAVVPPLVVAMLVSACLVPVFRAEEKRWFARDRLLELTPRFTRFEAAVADQLFAELREVLGYH